MGHQFAAIAFTEEVKRVQQEKNSRAGYASMEQGEDFNYLLSEREVSFISERDSFYMASVSETGWPYVQHRGVLSGSSTRRPLVLPISVATASTSALEIFAITTA
jgi:hypothetical protein